MKKEKLQKNRKEGNILQMNRYWTTLWMKGKRNKSNNIYRISKTI